MSTDPAGVSCVVDTNVVAAGLLIANAESPPAHILTAMVEGRLPFLLSLDLLAEYRDVLLRPKLARRHGLTEDEIDRVLEAITFFGRLREPRPARADPPDPRDRHLWELLACEPRAILITGDRALLDSPPPDHSVVTPGDAMRMF